MHKTTFLHSLHWFRGIAILFVVMSHVQAQNSNGLFDVFKEIFSNGTFLFVFIAGYLFWHLIDRFEYKKYLRQKFLFVVLPYTMIFGFTVLLIILLEFFQINAIKFQGGVTVSFLEPFKPFEGVLWHYMIGGSLLYALWFIPFIVIIFLFSFVLFNLGHKKYFVYIMLFFLIVSLVTFRPNLEKASSLYPVYMFMHFIGIFMFGMYLKQKQEFFYKNSSLLSMVFGFGFILVIFFKVFLNDFDLSVRGVSQVINIDQLKMLLGSVFFLTILFLIEKRMDNYKNNYLQSFFLNPLAILATYSFGIFFIHGLVIKLVRKMHLILIGEITTVINYIVFSVSVILISLVMVVLIHRVLGKKSRYVIGS